jgi:hypothetical protein
MELKRMMVAGALMALAGGVGAIAQQGTQPGTQPGSTQPPTRYPGQPGRDTMRDQPPGLSRTPMGQDKVTQADLDRVSTSWPQASKTALREITQKYGLPTTATPIMAVWQNNGPWKYTIVYGTEVQHSFPAPHTDVLEQFIDFKVPVEKVGDLAQFDGSLIVARTPGLLAAWCDKEGNNFAAINLANEIITGKTTVQEARQKMAQEAMNVKEGRTTTYSSGFMFEPEHGRTGDPDSPVTPTGTPGSTPGMEKPATMPGQRPGSTEPGSPSTNPRPGEPTTPPSSEPNNPR